MRRVTGLLIALVAPAAWAEPWLCTLPDGRKEFSYEAESAKQRNCVDVPISRGYVRRAPLPGAESDATGHAFPRVDVSTQKKRDIARREILERELEQERKALADAIRQLDRLKVERVQTSAPALVREFEDRIRTHRTNIANLERELAGAG